MKCWLMLQPLDWGLLPRAALGVLALLAGNGYIVGINQIYDVDIDTVSKPFLPIAAGTPLDARHLCTCPFAAFLLDSTGAPFLEAMHVACILECNILQADLLVLHLHRRLEGAIQETRSRKMAG